MPDSRWSHRGGSGRSALIGTLTLLLAGLVAALVTAYGLEHRNQAERTKRFASSSRQLADDISEQLKAFEHGLRGARGVVIASSGNIRRERFLRYSQSREYAREFPGVLGFGYVQRVAPQEEATFVQETRADGAPNFDIRQWRPHDGDRFVVLYLQPEPARDGPAGVDLASEDARREAAVAAARSGNPVITSPLSLKLAPAYGRNGFLILLPNYREGASLATPDQREQATTGWSFAVLGIDHLLAHSAGHMHDLQTSLADAQTPDGPFFNSAGHQRLLRSPAAVTLDLPIYGRHWLLTTRPTPSFLASLNQTRPWLAACLVFGAFVLLSALLYFYLANRFRSLQVLRKQTELASLVSHSSEAIIAEDRNGEITRWNPAAEQIFGYDAAEILGRDRIELLAPQPYLPSRIAELMPLLEKVGNPQVQEMRHRDGRSVYVMSSTAPIINEHGHAWGQSHFVRDVTDRVLAQQRVLQANVSLERQVAERTRELVRSSALQQAILAHAGYAIIATNPTGVVTLFNPAAERLLGYSAHSMIGSRGTSLFLDQGELERRAALASELASSPVPPLLEAIAAETTLGRSDTTEWTYIRKDGRRLPVLMTLSTLLDQDDHVLGYLSVAVDLSEQKFREQQLRLAMDAAESANQYKSDFLANMSHEIRTPMNAILGMLYLLQRGNLTPAAKDMVQKIDLSARGLLEIINDILDFSKIEAGRIDLELEPFDLNQLLEEIAGLMSHALANKPVQMIVDFLPAHGHWFKGDALRINQVLINLVGNAVKFTEQGEVSLSVRPFRSNESNRDKLLFTVRDSGIGISREKQALIFSPFLQADTSTSRQFGGSGLGLTISARLVDLMGGQLEVTSTLGQGSEFYFVLTLERAPIEDQPSAGPLLQAPERRQRVLIADDHELVLANLAVIATNLGWDVQAVTGGQQALDAIRASAGDPFDIYLLDWRMPDIDGLDVAKHIRDNALPGKHPVIVMVTAYERNLLEQQAEQPGIDAVMTKPITATALHRTVTDLQRENPHAPQPGIETDRQRLTGARLLLVDDSEINSEVAQRILQGEGATVEVAHDGEQALAMLRDNPTQFQLVLMDVQMPHMDGYEATRLLRKEPALSKLPVIALTAGAFRQQQDLALKAGMDGFIAKPYQVDELVAIIRQFLPRTEQLPRLPTLPAPPGVAPQSAGWRTSNPDLLDGTRAKSFWSEPSPYQRYLSKFLQDDPDPAGALAALLSDGHQAAAIAMTHKLRGSAGSLALLQLSETAGQLEHELEQGHSGLDVLQQLRMVMKETTLVIEDFLRHNATQQPPQSPTPRSVDAHGSDDPLPELIAALESDDPDIIEQQLARAAPYLPGDVLAILHSLVGNFDFRLAEDQVRRYQADRKE